MKNEPVNLAAWIQEGSAPILPDRLGCHGVMISNCIPGHFESYCKVFHPFYIELDSVRYYDDEDSGAISWKDLAQKCGIIFHNQVNRMSFNAPSDPKFFKGKKVLPCEGALPRNLLKSVLASIENVTKSDQAFLYQVFPHSLPIEEMEVLYRCSFEEIMAFAKSYFTGYIFSRDRSWVLFTDADLDFTLVGGAKELISALHATAEIETLICDAATRVDYRGDLLNS